MKTVDAINQRYQNALEYASSMETKEYRNWVIRQAYLSPAYTTRWSDLPRVLIK